MFNLDSIFTREKSRSLRSISASVKIAKRIKLSWPELFKGRMSDDLTFGYYKKFTLGIYTTNFCWVNEINVHKGMIIKNIESTLKKEGVVKYIKVHHMTEEPPREVKKKGYKNTQEISFEEKIKRENELKRLRGARLCDICKVVYTSKIKCVFCDTRQV